MTVCWECRQEGVTYKHYPIPRIEGGRRSLRFCAACYSRLRKQWNCEEHALLTREGLEKVRREGKRIGNTPYGFDLAKDGATLVPNKKEQEVTQKILRMRESGKTARAIADFLTNKKIPTKLQKSQGWTHQAVFRILERNGRHIVSRRERIAGNKGVVEQRTKCKILSTKQEQELIKVYVDEPKEVRLDLAQQWERLRTAGVPLNAISQHYKVSSATIGFAMQNPKEWSEFGFRFRNGNEPSKKTKARRKKRTTRKVKK